MVNALLAAGADATVQDHSGSSALHRSAGVGAAEVLRALCVAAPRSALELVDKLGCTPFHVSVEERREECVMVLAEAGANIRCKAGEVALESVPARIREQIRVGLLVHRRLPAGARLHGALRFAVATHACGTYRRQRCGDSRPT